MLAMISVALLLPILLVCLAGIVGGMLAHAGVVHLARDQAPPLAPARVGRPRGAPAPAVERIAAWLLILLGLALPAIALHGIAVAVAELVEAEGSRGFD
jgi:hypothetical protein